MKISRVVWMIVATLGFIGPSRADESARCYNIRNADVRAACLAETRHASSRCYAIRDTDRRYLCLAQTTGNKSRCYSIHDHDLRNACLAGMGR